MSYIPMPFSRRARFVLVNDGNVRYSRLMAYSIDYEKDSVYAKEKSRFHSTWRRSNPTEDGLHTILDVHGSGQYVGNFLQVFTRYSGWWGEGDTIFYVDGNAMTHTPGTEDEYCLLYTSSGIPKAAASNSTPATVSNSFNAIISLLLFRCCAPCVCTPAMN